MSSRKPGRRIADAPGAKAKALEALRLGNTRRSAAAYAGVSHDTFADWKNKDEAFALACRQAEVEGEMWHVANIRRVAELEKQWTASAWWLERRNPHEWGKREKIEHSGPAGGPIAFREVDVYKHREEPEPAEDALAD
jgi:hypothetical protein